MNDKTTEFSFILKCCSNGIGVFAVHDIEVNTFLRLFAEKGQSDNASISRRIENVPELFRSYCLNRGNTIMTPKDFGRIEIGWYLNHSNSPNAYHKNYEFYSLCAIKAGDEITINYNELEEPDNAKDDFYKGT
jgi:hypothetical protein